MVKTKGWEDTCLILGLNPQELVELFFNNDPMEFLNLFNDLDVVQSEIDPDTILYRYKPGHNLMIYDKYDGNIFVDEIFLVTFNVGKDTTQNIIKKWLGDVYGLDVVRVLLTDFRDLKKYE